MKHGEWILPKPKGCMIWDENAYKECSVCGMKQFLAHEMKYCPHCGAKMDGAKSRNWISVRDQLPVIDEDVLVCAVNKTTGEQSILITSMEDTLYYGASNSVKIDPRWKSPYQYFSENNTITHWMPLPMPPDKEPGQDEEA